MSYKRQLQAHYHNFLDAILTISLPEWLTGRTMRIGMLSFVMFMSVAYMGRINSAATSGYETRDLEKQLSEMNQEVQELNIKIADASSMNSLQKRLATLNMVSAENVVRYNAGAVVAMAR